MITKKNIILIYVPIKSIFFFLSILILQVNAETNIIAKDGDTLYKLSKQYGVSLKDLMHKNNFNNANKSLRGKHIIIPIKREIPDDFPLLHKVTKGDTLYKIARNYKVSVKDIISINNLDNASLLKPNQIILLPNETSNKKVFNKNIKTASIKVSYHQTSKTEELTDISQIHKVPIEEIITLNKLNNQKEIKPNTKLKIRKTKRYTLRWLRYGQLLIDWSDWRYLNGYYTTKAKNKLNKSFFLALSCEKRALNNSLKNGYWTSWYFPRSDFEFKLINDFCNQSFKI